MLIWQQAYDKAIIQVTQRLLRAGLQVVRTFDLESACADPCGVCPHHGTAPCNCHMAILLIYDTAAQPVTVMVYGCDEQTSFSLVDTPRRHTDPGTEGLIVRAIAFDNLSGSMDP